MATNTLLTAHLVVQFEDGDDRVSIIAEVDDRENGYNAGRTTFYIGDNVYLLLFVPNGYEVYTVIPSAGAITYVAEDYKVIDAYLPFANEDEASLSYPMSSNFTQSWLGNNLGVLSVPDQFTAKLPPRGFNVATKKPIPEYRVGIAQVGYRSNCKVYRLANVPAACVQVMVFFVVKKSGT